RWELRFSANDAGAEVELQVERGQIERVRDWLPAGGPRPGAGTVTGTVTYRSGASDIVRLQAGLAVEGLGFTDASGLHAGEGIRARLEAGARGAGDRWEWEIAVDWSEGAVFWDPVYVPGGVKVAASGRYGDRQLAVSSLQASLPGAVSVTGTGRWDAAAGRLAVLELAARAPDLADAFAQWAAPLLTGSRWAEVKVAGAAQAEVSLAEGELRAADLAFERVMLDDPGAAMALNDASGRLRWRAGQREAGEIAWTGGSVYGVPIGAARVPLDIQPDGLRIARAEVPVLDGTLALSDARVTRSADGWSWDVAGGLSAVSMELLSARLGWPEMRGSLSAVVPRVSYRERLLDVDGALLFRVFDGTAVARDLRLEDPLGRAPRLTAQIEMRELDLDLLTRAFSFGSMEGRIDVDVRGLELVNWAPVAFDARIASSPGDYPRTISQRAVENISALGGAGAAAAIQRTFLRFFEKFRYRRLGLSCQLRDGVCRMDGVAPAPQGYVIVEGGGLPAITVIGYNRAVGWNELIGRLQRITQTNVTPVIQ
ncbi:MAG TPA: hypothetical protein VLW45_01855, partial [Pelomicrobium sp.]|nr:hypothetical protein [Pelomicrobium sp.]